MGRLAGLRVRETGLLEATGLNLNAYVTVFDVSRVVVFNLHNQDMLTHHF